MNIHAGETYVADLEGEERVILVINEHAGMPFVAVRDMQTGAILRVPLDNIIRHHCGSL
jgi:hypothetical protein